MWVFFVWFLCDLNEHHIEIGQWDGGRNFSKNIYQQQKKKNWHTRQRLSDF